jgi:glutamate formiminotransferase/formiminotetrahydrofolate cyclodeaminase
VSDFECVPNFSEGRDAERIERIVAPARHVAGVAVLDVERNADHHRSVVSLAGPGPALLEAVLGMMRVAVREIDLNHHRGEHPRMGAVDVVPFVPLGGATMAEAVALANELAERVYRELRVPVYLYAAAARRPDRQDLGQVRKGEFEGLRTAVREDPARAPDVGERELHPTAGIVAIGARPVLIAYNAYLSTPDVSVAKRVAHAVRARDGGLSEVKALGFEIAERHRAQVSMNLTDHRKTPVHRALELVRREAARYGASVEESEVVGLIPEDALFDAAEYYLQLNRFDRANVLERKLRASAGAGTSRPGGPLAHLALSEFSERLAARTPTPGGGSAAAAVAALGAALGAMVLAYSLPAENPSGPLVAVLGVLESERRELIGLIDADADAYEAVRATRKAVRAAPAAPEVGRAWEEALRRAAEVPLATARRAERLLELLETHRHATKPTVGSDLVTALALLRAAKEGALANVATNLDELRGKGLPVGDLTAELERLRGRAP